MNIASNLDKAAGSLKSAEVMILKIQAESRSAKDPTQYLKENKKHVINRLNKELNTIATERLQLLLNNIGEAKTEIDRYFKNTKGTASDNIYHLQRSARLAQAKNVEEVQAGYGRLIESLSPEERKLYRRIYDFELQERIHQLEPADTLSAEAMIDKFRDAEEKRLIRDFKMQLALFEQNKTINAALEAEAKNLADGEGLADFSWTKILDEMRANALHQISSPAEISEEARAAALQINPYDEAAEAEAEEALAVNS